MSILGNLRTLARYNVFTPMAVLGALAASPAFAQTLTIDDPETNGVFLQDFDGQSWDSLVNNATITNDPGNTAAGSEEAVTSIINNGSVVGDEAEGFFFRELVGSFTNNGSVTGEGYNAIFIRGGVTTFTNEADGVIENTDAEFVDVDNFGGGAVSFNTDTDTGGVVNSFINHGTIRAASNMDTVDNNNRRPTVSFFSDSDGSNVASQVGSFQNSGLITGLGTGIAFDGGVGMFTNSGTIRGAGYEVITVRGMGTTTSFINEVGGLIENTDAGANGGSAIIFGTDTDTGGVVESFVNHGTIWAAANMDNGSLRPTIGFFSDQDNGSGIANQVGSFLNSGLITGQGTGIVFDGGVDSFTNEAGGSIASAMQGGVYSGGPVGTFTNAGSVSGQVGVIFDGMVTDFANDAGGTISGTTGNGVLFNADVTTFANAGTIATGDPTNEVAVRFDGGLGSFNNAAGGTVTGGVWVSSNATVDSFSNAGTINNFATNGALFSAVAIEGFTNTFTNSGTIVATGNAHAAIDIGGATTFTNSGTIAGGVYIRNGGVGNFINSGTLKQDHSFWAWASEGVFNEKITILTGSELYGAVNFGDGDDMFDFSGFAGTAVIGVLGLEEDGIVSGSRTYATAGDLQTNGAIGIFDPTGTTAIGSATGDIVGTLQSVIAGQIGGSGGGLPGDALVNAFAPEPELGEAAHATAVMSHLDTGAPSDMTLWGATFGGGSYDDAPVALTNLYGGLVLGAHAALADKHTLGGVGAYARSVYDVDGQQTITSDTGVLGAYGQSDLGVVKLDYALLGGASSHASSRDVVVLNVLETLSGSFSSWFLAPSAGISLPILADNGAEVNVAASASYIFGGVSSYTEESTSLSIAVGAQDIGIFEGRLEINGKVAVAATDAGDVTLRGKAGLLVQANRGGSTMPITFAGSVGGNPLSASTSYTAPGTTSYGGFAGIGLSVPVAHGVAVNLDAGGSMLDNGTTQGQASAGLSGAF